VRGAALAGGLRRTYLQLDPRSLGLGRIALGLALLWDLLRRVPVLRDFYSNLGLIPNHTVLWRPPHPRLFSVFFMSSLPEESALWFLFAFACFFCLLIGYRTRLAQVLSFVMATSLHNRILFAENWGAVALAVLMVWTMFLPLGQRFSVDAVRTSLRARRGETPEQLAAGLPPPDMRATTSLAVLGLLLQIGVIYWFNFASKTGATWRDGSAIHYVLHQERIVTPVGLLVREHLPYAATQLLTKATLAIEAMVPFLVLTPLFWRWTRFAAALLLLGLHGSIALLVNLGIFSGAMCAFLPYLLTDAQWALAARLVPKRGRTRDVFYDVDCGVCWAVVRVLARLDVHHRLRWISNRDLTALPAGADPALLERTILVVDPARDRRWTRAEAFAEIFGALPLGRWWAWPLRLPLVRAAAGRAYDAFARNRTAISEWLGLAACGVPAAGPASPRPAPQPDETPLRDWLRARLPVGREVGAAIVFLTLAAGVSVSNPSLPSALRLRHRPVWMIAAVDYTDLSEGWGMFAPEAPRTDQTITIDAVTRSGRHVDPYNEVAGRTAQLPVGDVPVRLGYDSFFIDYTLQIPDAPIYYQALIEWVLRYPERTGRGGDEIKSFDAYVVQHDSPPPGETTPTHVRKRRFLHYP
jgi:predicted DCC family thiol-disulfide oxidoreductase YuxK